MGPRRVRDWLAAGVVACVLAAAIIWLPGEEADGPASVIDGDSLLVGGREVRIFGIDAPEARQTCGRPDGRSWPCGREAAALLGELVAGSPVECSGREEDRYGRLVARCRAGGVDLGAEMVRRGLALAYRRRSEAYAGEEAEAERARQGLWSGDFEAPWDWRESRRGGD